MPKLWTDTVNEHRREVTRAILDATEALVAERGLHRVTMAAIAERAGIGRATLYRYFGDVDAILREWHARHVGDHLHGLMEIGHGPGAPADRLARVLEGYAAVRRRGAGGEIAGHLHAQEHVADARSHLTALVAELIDAGAAAGELRRDVRPRELAVFCLHALEAASALPSDRAVRRLVAVTLDGLRPRAVPRPG